jgi:Kef-type K+ transport system membrane component KefB
LIGLVFEGGLATDLSLLKKTAYLSVSVATIGLAVPIALSFILLLLPFASSSGIAYPTPLAGFSAGASLCSTSLGTTFAILSSANMQQTRVGVLLVGAAMMDDVVGLVMVNIVITLGNGGAGGWPIARPIAASFGLLLVTLAICPYVLKPVWSMLVNYLLPKAELSPNENPKSLLRAALGRTVLKIPHLSFSLSIAVLIVFVTIASFTNASILFAAFIAGGVVKFLWVVHPDQSSEDSKQFPSGMYDKYFKPVTDYVLAPFFFVSALLLFV